MTKAIVGDTGILQYSTEISRLPVGTPFEVIRLVDHPDRIEVRTTSTVEGFSRGTTQRLPLSACRIIPNPHITRLDQLNPMLNNYFRGFKVLNINPRRTSVPLDTAQTVSHFDTWDHYLYLRHLNRNYSLLNWQIVREGPFIRKNRLSGFAKFLRSL